jgi:glucose-6-phosphate isomerase, archaeal
VTFDPGFDIRVLHEPMGFRYGPGVFGPEPENRSLDSIRPSLSDPGCEGPDPVYAIAMDVGKREHRDELMRRMLLFGVVTYAAGRLGSEPVRSQGHVHRISVHSGWSPPEIYEIWSGRAVVYMQESTLDDPGRCFAVTAGPGEVVVVPPGWGHATISADPLEPLTFGAWCDREYGFEYGPVRAHGGLAWFAFLGSGGELEWRPNPRYRLRDLAIGPPRGYPELGLVNGVSIYRQFENNPAAIQWVSKPGTLAASWKEFDPVQSRDRVG